MMGKAKKEVISSRLEVLLKVGLGELVKEDLLLGKYACVALQQLAATKQSKGKKVKRIGFIFLSFNLPIKTKPANPNAPRPDRMDIMHPLFKRLADLVLEVGPTENREW